MMRMNDIKTKCICFYGFGNILIQKQRSFQEIHKPVQVQQIDKNIALLNSLLIFGENIYSRNCFHIFKTIQFLFA